MNDARSWYSATLQALETADGPRRRKRRRSSVLATSGARRGRARVVSGGGGPGDPAKPAGGGGGGGVDVNQEARRPVNNSGGGIDVNQGGDQGGGVVINPGGGGGGGMTPSVSTVAYSPADFSASAMLATMRGLGRRGRRIPCIGPMAGLGCARCGGTCGRRG